MISSIADLMKPAPVPVQEYPPAGSGKKLIRSVGTMAPQKQWGTKAAFVPHDFTLDKLNRIYCAAGASGEVPAGSHRMNPEPSAPAP